MSLEQAKARVLARYRRIARRLLPKKTLIESNDDVTFYRFPVELWLHIMTFLTTSDLKSLSCACKYLRGIALRSLLQSFSLDGGVNPKDPWRLSTLPIKYAPEIRQLHYTITDYSGVWVSVIELYFHWRQRSLFKETINLYSLHLYDISIPTSLFMKLVSHPPLRELKLDNFSCWSSLFTRYDVQTNITKLTLAQDSEIPDEALALLARGTIRLTLTVNTNYATRVAMQDFPLLTHLTLSHKVKDSHTLTILDTFIQQCDKLTSLSYCISSTIFQCMPLANLPITDLAINSRQTGSFEDLATVERLRIIGDNSAPHYVTDSLRDKKRWRNVKHCTIHIGTRFSKYCQPISEFLGRLTHFTIWINKSIELGIGEEPKLDPISVRRLLKAAFNGGPVMQSLIRFELQHNGPYRIPRKDIRSLICTSRFLERFPSIYHMAFSMYDEDQAPDWLEADHFKRYSLFAKGSGPDWTRYDSD